MNQGLLSLYQQIKHFILNKIECDESRKRSSEKRRCQQILVNWMRSETAQQKLISSSILMYQQGLRILVAPLNPQSSMLTTRNIADEIIERGHGYSNRVLLPHEEKAFETIAISLELPESATISHSIIVIVHYEDSLPLRWEERYINQRFAPNYQKQDFPRETSDVYLDLITAPKETTHAF